MDDKLRNKILTQCRNYDLYDLYKYNSYEIMLEDFTNAMVSSGLSIDEITRVQTLLTSAFGVGVLVMGRSIEKIVMQELEK